MKLNEIVNVPQDQFLTDNMRIHAWLKENIHDYNKLKYTIDPTTSVVDVQQGSILLSNKMDKLPIKFGTVNGTVYMLPEVDIKSLYGCPYIITNGRFDVHQNTSLKSFIGGPAIVHGNVDFEVCANVSSLEGIPKEIHGYLNIAHTDITSLHNIHKHIKLINGDMTISDITDSICGVFLIRKLMKIRCQTQNTRLLNAIEIVNKHLTGDRSGPNCQVELQDAGLSEFAKL